MNVHVRTYRLYTVLKRYTTADWSCYGSISDGIMLDDLSVYYLLNRLKIKKFEKWKEYRERPHPERITLPLTARSRRNVKTDRFKIIYTEGNLGHEDTNMITPEHEYYARYMLLLLQCGTHLLREIVEKALGKKNETLNQFLQSIQNTVAELEQRKRHLTQTQKKNTLYPATPQGAIIETFDITLLSYLILTHLQNDVDVAELRATEKIRDARNAYSHSNAAKIETLKYIEDWGDLAKTILTVGSNISSEVHRRHKDIIDSILCKSQHEIKSILEVIEKHDPSKEFLEKLEKIIAKTDLIQGGQETLAVAVQKLQNTEDKNIRGDVHNQPNDQETNDEVVTALNGAVKRFDDNLPPNDVLQEKISELCEDVKDCDSKVQSVGNGSIQFEFKCVSLTAILELIVYFYSQTFQKHLDDIAAAFEEVTGKKISLTAYGITRQSLQDINRNFDMMEAPSNGTESAADTNTIEQRPLKMKSNERIKDIHDKPSNEPGSRPEVLATSSMVPGSRSEVLVTSSKVPGSRPEVLATSSKKPDSRLEMLATSSKEPDSRPEVPDTKANVPVKEKQMADRDPFYDFIDSLEQMESPERVRGGSLGPSLSRLTRAVIEDVWRY